MKWLLLKMNKFSQMACERYKEFKPVVIDRLLNLYSKLLYENHHSYTFRNQEVAACVICLTKKRFWLIMFSLLPTVFMSSESLQYPLVSLYISINAAGIFYIVFNLYPEVKQNFRSAKQAYLLISNIRKRRAWLYSEFFDVNFFTEANRFLSKEKFSEIIEMLRKANGYRTEPCGNSGKSIYYTLTPPLAIAIKNREINVIGYDVQTLQDACVHIARDNLKDIQKLKEIPNISALALYDAISYLEREMELILPRALTGLYENDLVSYFLYAPDKLNYYAQKELPYYVGGRFDLKFEATKEESMLARELSTKCFART
ncbi:hypothetical protein GNP79_19450 [Aliivibrio fischeri]|uniref:Uncharacterized protein n=3 Tax=Vibrionaceae TaxID=641 RepID=A0A844NYM4_ALIFS|nr:hypothetical protein [Aliivibrio fischeri]MUK48268.1 hypothetical protein [Aliivibrio fischeri]MUK82955.1 hypothetical protein [Aliivibrio fischeri]MUK86762.1 hypothetical protein [Aliivibrio fischeri]